MPTIESSWVREPDWQSNILGIGKKKVLGTEYEKWSTAVHEGRKPDKRAILMLISSGACFDFGTF